MSSLFVGLGNPGKRYESNRHNIGFLIIEHILSHISHSNISKSKFFGNLYKFEENFFLMPTTFMNNSGDSVKAVKDYFNIDNTFVFHDDLDLNFGTIKFKFAGGHGGHNGLRSIDSCISPNYTRIRVGISKPEFKNDVANYVLSDFSKEQKQCIPSIQEYCFKVLTKLEKKDINTISSKFNTKNICDENIH